MHYNVGKYLSEVLNPLTSNEYTIKDSFDAVTRIKNIPQELFDQGYIFVSFDVVSLFTNVPLQKTIDIILKKVYVEKVINTTVKKNSMRKLIKNTCKKTAFVFVNEIYEQIDGVSMGSPLAPVLPNIIMTELENTMIKNLFVTGKIKFYCRYVDDTLLLMKPEDIQLVQNLFNSFHKNLRFTVDHSKMKCRTCYISECQHKVRQFIVKIPILDNMFIMIVLLHGIINSVGSVVSLQEPNVFVV